MTPASSPVCSILVPTAFLAMLALPSCSQEPAGPRAENVAWSVKRLPDKSGYQVTGGATFARGVSGWYQPIVTLVDARGCINVSELPGTHIANADSVGAVAARFDYKAKVTRPVARGTFTIEYRDLPGFSTNPADMTKQVLYSSDAVIDANVRPPELAENACGKSKKELAATRRERLREKAKSDPDGADAEAIGNMGQYEVLATAINSAGFLCARVRDATPRGGAIVVTCTEYRRGRGTARYRIDTNAMEVVKLD